MANALSMLDHQFESKKNWRATSYTIGVVGVLLTLFIIWKWDLPALETPVMEEGLEVNLGNSDAGLGDDQPFLPGKPAQTESQAYIPPQRNEPKQAEESKDFATDDKDKEAPEIKKPAVTKPESTKVPDKEVVKSKPVVKPQPEAPPTPPAPKPKNLFKGSKGDGTGGNDADNFKKGGSEGIAGGRGDQGAPGGDPDSKNYIGGGRGNGGIKISKGLTGRSITRVPALSDEFNENAKVAVNIRVNEQGNVISAEYTPLGSTTSDPSYKEIARKKAMQVKFSPGSSESSGTIVFDFKIKN